MPRLVMRCGENADAPYRYGDSVPVRVRVREPVRVGRSTLYTLRSTRLQRSNSYRYAYADTYRIRYTYSYTLLAERVSSENVTL